MHIEYPPSLSVSDIVKNLKDEVQENYRWNLKSCPNILGKTFLGNRLWCMDYRECKPRHG